MNENDKVATRCVECSCRMGLSIEQMRPCFYNDWTWFLFFRQWIEDPYRMYSSVLLHYPSFFASVPLQCAKTTLGSYWKEGRKETGTTCFRNLLLHDWRWNMWMDSVYVSHDKKGTPHVRWILLATTIERAFFLRLVRPSHSFTLGGGGSSDFSSTSLSPDASYLAFQLAHMRGLVRRQLPQWFPYSSFYLSHPDVPGVFLRWAISNESHLVVPATTRSFSRRIQAFHRYADLGLMNVDRLSVLLDQPKLTILSPRQKWDHRSDQEYPCWILPNMKYTPFSPFELRFHMQIDRWIQQREAMATKAGELSLLPFVTPVMRSLLHSMSVCTISQLKDQWEHVSTHFRKDHRRVVGQLVGVETVPLSVSPAMASVWASLSKGEGHRVIHFVDFETWIYPHTLYLIGVYTITVPATEQDGTGGRGCYRSFWSLDKENPKEELRIMKEFQRYVTYQCPGMIMYFFAENMFWKRSIARHGWFSVLSYHLFEKNSIDLYREWRFHGWVLEGVPNHKLKSLARGLLRQNKEWKPYLQPSGKASSHGLGSVEDCFSFYSLSSPSSTSSHKEIQRRVEEYNRVDCTILYCLFEWMKKRYFLSAII